MSFQAESDELLTALNQCQKTIDGLQDKDAQLATLSEKQRNLEKQKFSLEQMAEGWESFDGADGFTGKGFGRHIEPGG